jgi:DNA-binding HxlR family transcriptional regulator
MELSSILLRMSKQQSSASLIEAQEQPVRAHQLRPGRPARGTRTGRPLLVAFDLLGRRWALRILWELRTESLGFRALQARCEGMSSSVLRDRLVELVGAGLLKTDGAKLYGLSPQGQRLLNALKPLSRWADGWAAES